MKSLIKSLLRVEPLRETEEIRSYLETAASRHPSGHTFCYTPRDEGDLIHSLILKWRLTRCLETGFATGSTALYMLFATKERDGTVVSIDSDEYDLNRVGVANIGGSQMGSRHQLIEKDSSLVIPELYCAGETFDFFYVDGRKSFDHLAFELYMVDRMLSVGGIVMFDDTDMPGPRQAIRLLKRYYGFQEINYADYHQPWRLRLWQILTTRTFFRPYRALRKMSPTEEQPRNKTHFWFRRIW